MGKRAKNKNKSQSEREANVYETVGDFGVYETVQEFTANPETENNIYESVEDFISESATDVHIPMGIPTTGKKCIREQNGLNFGRFRISRRVISAHWDIRSFINQFLQNN